MHEAKAADRGYDRGDGTSAEGPGADCQSRKLDSSASSVSRMNWQDDLGWSFPECPFPPPHEGWIAASVISFSFRVLNGHHCEQGNKERPPPPATPSLCPGASLGLSLQQHKYLQLIPGLGVYRFQTGPHWGPRRCPGPALVFQSGLTSCSQALSCLQNGFQ